MSIKATALSTVQQALVIRAIRATTSPPMNGLALIRLRDQVKRGLYDDHPAAQESTRIVNQIADLNIGDMPPDPELVATLVEALSQRHDGAGHAEAWQRIGINPHRGRGLLSRSSRAVDWPIWYTLKNAVLWADLA